ncbi:LbetaH domain-containing protein [Paenibacillus dauci]|uniref:hypothetical protein n=1 Tax=Paenibacillus dauci TaxID=1567106 RepID=UPI0006984AEA|nr:hypothetical protein [Paenibacillus dauci]
MFELSLSVEDFKLYVLRQLNHFFPDNKFPKNEEKLHKSFLNALDRTEYCFKHVALKSYHHDNKTFLSHTHSDQYTLFLWFFSNSLWKEYEDSELASKVFYLNKMLNGLTCMYDAEMPEIFLVIHGGGIVLGKASYSNFFVCYQGCTVGAINGIYPILGKGVAMAPQSSIIGNCRVGNLVTIGNQALLRNSNLEDGSICYRDSETGSQKIVSSKKEVWAQSFFNTSIC